MKLRWQLKKHIKDSLKISIFLILIPLAPMFFIKDIGDIFLNYVMQKTGVRIEKASLYIKELYANLIELPKRTTKEIRLYKTFIF